MKQASGGTQKKSRRPVLAGAAASLGLSEYPQAKRTVVETFLFRRRIAKPTAPMPRIIIAQVAGSGTAAAEKLKLSKTTPSPVPELG